MTLRESRKQQLWIKTAQTGKALTALDCLGRLDDEEIARELGLRPVFVSLARYEPFGLAVLEAAGGSVLTPEGQPFAYGKASEGFRNGWFVARGG